MLCADESMMSWAGASEAHISYIPRKPHPLGIQVKTICDARSGIWLDRDLVEGKEADSKKEFFADFGSTTSTTLRLARRWFGSGKCIVADAWFGSCRTAEELRENGVHCIMSVKIGHKGYPKKELLEACKERGQVKTLKCQVQLGWENEGPVEDFYAMCHMDKKPMLIISTCGMTLPGPNRQRDRYVWENGAIVHRTWTLQQPHMMAVYRANFNAVDRLNKEAFGRTSLCEAIGTKTWWKRVWFGLLAMSTQNAYHAFVKPW